MTYDAALVGTGKQEKKSAVQVVLSTISDFFNCLPIRMIIVFAIAAMIVPFVADFAYPSITGSMYTQLTGQLADEAKKKLPTQPKILRMMQEYNLAWYYISSPDGSKIEPVTKPFAPDFQRYDIQTRDVEWHEQKFHEVVTPIGEGKLLHVGFFKGFIMPHALSMSGAAALAPAPLAYLYCIIAGMAVLAIGGLLIFVSKPLGLLYRACSSLLLARDAYSGVTGGGLDVSGSVTEVMRISSGLREIRRQYDEQVAARVAKEEELRRQRLHHEQEKKSLTAEYDDQILLSQQKISELHTKEAEEEFINALGKEIDVLKSSHQVCQRILDKLSDKYPTSIMYGAFYQVDKMNRPILDASLGFEDKSLQVLKKHDATKLMREAFLHQKPISLSSEGLRDNGLLALAQANGLKNAVYIPVHFQGRQLGLMSIYFTTEGQNVQQRIRVLRNVTEMAARILYQVVLYEEELEAARTDPLTGLRNKKFFYEIMPKVFQRASVNPQANPISLMMMDGDHFKSINDTYGHQVGDLMLQDLAKTIRQCIRTQDSLEASSGPGDYLIRYGGEEFIIVMENTDGPKACAVAERIREAIAQKTDWPGGIAQWTVSIGVSTYPVDGKNTDEILLKADTALYYVKEELGRNKVCHSNQVPKSFKSAKVSANIGGELGVFDPAALLQSLATAQKTGVLTVQGPDGRQLWTLFDTGRPIQARLGKVGGNNAIVEFISTFEEGNFNFQEKGGSGKDTQTKLPKLDPAFNISKPTEMLLMSGALAQDNYNAAKKYISTLDIYIRPVEDTDFEQRWEAMQQVSDPPMPDELALMTTLIEQADGTKTLGQIFRSMEGITTAHFWRCAGMLVQFELVETKMKVSS